MMDFGKYVFFFLDLQSSGQCRSPALLLTPFCLCNNEQFGYTTCLHQMAFQSIDPVQSLWNLKISCTTGNLYAISKQYTIVYNCSKNDRIELESIQEKILERIRDLNEQDLPLREDTILQSYYALNAQIQNCILHDYSFSPITVGIICLLYTSPSPRDS